MYITRALIGRNLCQGMRKSASMAAWCQEIFKEKQDIKNEAREISKISIKVTNIT
jgi:hypothetical protein